MDSRRGYLQKKSSESTIITIVHNIIFHLLQSPLWWEAVKQRQGLEAISVQPRLTLPLQQCICTPSLPHTLPHHHCHTVPHNATHIATYCHTHLCRTPSLPHNYMLASHTCRVHCARQNIIITLQFSHSHNLPPDE